MTQQQLENRKQRAENETLVISRTDEGFRVYSPAYPSKSYIVTGSQEAPNCTCPDFEYHQSDPAWRCKHIVAVIDRLSRQPVDGPSDPYFAEEREAIQEESQPTAEQQPKQTAPANGNGHSIMLIKRSISPDGRIDSLSVEFSSPVEGLSTKEIKTRALKSMGLQADIVQSFLNGNKKANGQPPAVPESGPDGSVAAQLLNIAGMDGKWGRRLFINVKVNGHTLKLFGNKKQLGEHLAAAGCAHLAPQVNEGVHLNAPCRVITKPSEDGKYTNVERLLPAQTGQPPRRRS